MLKKLFTLLILLSLSIQSVWAITPTERDKLFTETVLLCKVFNKRCIVNQVRDDNLWAHTKYYGQIEISTGILETMDVHQVRGVLYHEAGHAILEHVEKTAWYLYNTNQNNTFNEQAFYELRRKYEFQADRFATYIIKLTRQREGLSEALLILVPPQYYHTTSDTHPSVADRIQQIRIIMRSK